MCIFIIFDSMITFASLFGSFYSLAIGNFDTLTWPLPFDMVVPFQTNTFFGWYSLWFYNLLCNLAYVACLTSTSSYYVCCCFYLGGLCDHFDFTIQALEKDVQQNRHEINPQKKRKRNHTIEGYLCKAIDIQNKNFE